MHRFLPTLLVFLFATPLLHAATGKAEAIQATRYTRIGDKVRIDIGVLKFFNKSYSVVESATYPETTLNTRGLSFATITAISGKYVADRAVIDKYQASDPGYLANFVFSKEFYPVVAGKTVYVVSFAAPVIVPVANIGVDHWTLKEGKNQKAVFKVTLSSAASKDLIIPFEVTGTARRITDYLPSNRSGKLKIKKGKKSAKITVTLVNDKLKEPKEELIYTILPGDKSDFKIGDDETATLLITDDDKKKK